MTITTAAHSLLAALDDLEGVEMPFSKARAISSAANHLRLELETSKADTRIEREPEAHCRDDVTVSRGGFLHTLSGEKARRVYYQDMVYDVANILDPFASYVGVAIGTVDEPSSALLDLLKEVIGGHGPCQTKYECPEGFDYTEEFRAPKLGEWYISKDTGRELWCRGANEFSRRIILRKL